MKCPSCEFENSDDAKFCSKCGVELNITSEKNVKEIKKGEVPIEERVEKAAKNLGEAAERIGKRIERRFEHSGKAFGQWFDKKFGVVGPIIWAFIALIITRIVIWMMTNAEDEIVVLGKIGTLLYDYLLLIFISFLISSYNTYFLRNYKKQYQWISPVVATTGLIIGLWILAKIFFVIDTELDASVLESLASIIESFIVVIFITVILISYGFMLIITPTVKK